MVELILIIIVISLFFRNHCKKDIRGYSDINLHKNKEEEHPSDVFDDLDKETDFF